MEIDPRFKAARNRAQIRKRNTWLKPTLIWGGLSLCLMGAVAGLLLSGVLTIGDPGIETTDDLAITETEMLDNAAAYSSAFADLAGDPMTLRFDNGGGVDKSRKMIRPFGIASNRAGNELVLLADDMITTQERLITTLPSSREDFAFFQAQRKTPMAMQPKTVVAVAPEENPAPVETVVVDEGDGSWGDNIEGVSENTATETYTKTKIQDTTSLAFLQPEKLRVSPYQDTFLRLKESVDLVKLMVGKGMDEASVKRFVEAGTLLIPELATLGSGNILAVRAAKRGNLTIPVQLSLYTRDSYGGTLAINDMGEVMLAADPWVEEDLFSYAGDDLAQEADIGRKYRLLDAFYSAAIRNRVPSAVVAEAIVLLSQAYDMESFAAPGDKMTLLYSPDPGTDGAGPGQVLYAAIKGDGRDLQCAVFKPNGKEEYSCFGKGTTGGGGGGGGMLRSGLVTPTQGVMTSRFGPRMHPILKVAKLHKGTDWAAPVGTPVVAAFAGTILLAGDGGTYGNLVKISHPGNLETRYAHLNAFAEGLKAGQEVKAGDLIGYIGTTGQSTGPHLHFELYENNVAVDPLAGGTTAVADSGDGSAVEVLVDQIIRVESGGNASAANPLSTAVGLGQFIQSTWLRMMKQYRPDLANSMSKEDLLALRTDPTLSREMVTALAREGEAYLRARGHQITAGRLYLCHFLGAEGANVALSSPDEALVIDAMGAGVVGANPFLKGKTIADLKQWAENKMNHKGGAAMPAAAVLPPEVQAYQKVVDTLIADAAPVPALTPPTAQPAAADPAQTAPEPQPDPAAEPVTEGD